MYRGLLAAIISIAGGYLLAQFGLHYLLPATFNFIFLSIMGFAGGVILGMILNWKPYIYHHTTQHVLYEIDDYDEFDRKIEDAMKGKSDSHNN